MSTPPPRPMAMDPLHITEFASDRYFTKFNQQQRQQQQQNNAASDLPVLQQLWLVTAEALILERKIVEKQSDIRRNAQVMLELIREDGFAEEDEWWYGQGAHDSIRPPLDSIEEDMTEDMTS
ncbi:hypothetical protein HMPREF1624_06192 [Sporothrix schenckii ATCC 58251]|uniref:Uncharacterized protein n=1 Tax=Sporothrix schenckii (strain ATCC 58251 / de Perez 2211183) TaxID=1391915 RepID=U7PTF3_SPOS1|nr:hypothetical protein HMPREF1624_06192 [Sporothrix schenckii ATCC 58251]